MRYIEDSEENGKTQVTTFFYGKDERIRQAVSLKNQAFWDVVGDNVLEAAIDSFHYHGAIGGLCCLIPGSATQGKYYSMAVLDKIIHDPAFQSNWEYRLSAKKQNQANVRHGRNKKENGIMKNNSEFPSFDEYIKSGRSGTKDTSLSTRSTDSLPGFAKYLNGGHETVPISPLNSGKDYMVSAEARGNTLAFAHPVDTELIKALDSPAVNSVIGKLVQAKYDSSYSLALSTGIHITNKTYPDLYDVLVECANTLKIPVPYAVISSSVPGINACAAGTDQFSFIMISSLLPVLMNRDELKFIIGHECGHIALGHVIYHTAGSIIGNMGALLPLVGPYIAQTISLPLKAWDRRSEISADRAGLVCCGSLDVAQKALYKLEAGMLGNVSIDIDEYIRESENLLNGSLIGKYSELKLEHPLLPKRMKALGYFAHSRPYAEFMGFDAPADWIGREKLNMETEKILEIM